MLVISVNVEHHFPCQQQSSHHVPVFCLCQIHKTACFLSTEPTACSATVTVGEMRITLDTTNIVAFHDLTSKYVYAIQGLVLEEDISESPCAKPKSRWTRESNTICPSPSVLQAGTVTALEDALSDAFSDNEYVVDAVRGLDCDASDFDDNLDPINIQLQIDEHCYTHVHPNHLNVYDFTGWVSVCTCYHLPHM